MIELISARGNTTLESAVTLTKEIRYDIQRLGKRLNDAANDEELLKRKSSRAKSREENERELKAIIAAINALLVRIEDAVPLINLAITTSGVNLSTKLSGTISPSRLLQASTFLTAADTKYMTDTGTRQPVGPTYTLSMYMLFAGHNRPADEEGIRQTTWKEVIHKARVKLVRVPQIQVYKLPGESGVPNGASLPTAPPASEFAYQLLLIEDLDDDRVHTFEDDEPQPGAFEDVPNAGIRDIIPIHEVSKIFYADTGKILNIGGDSDVNNPVLLLKRDVHARPPWERLHRSEMENHGYFDDTASVNGASVLDDVQSEVDAQFERESAPNTPLKQPPQSAHHSWRLPADLDPEWMAFEVYTEEEDSETEDDEPSSSHPSSTGPDLLASMSKLKLCSPTASPYSNGQPQQSPANAYPTIKTTLSLLEMLLKLTSLQQLRQDSHLAIEDELLNFFLEDSSTAGAMYGKEQRQRLRHEALRRVGFDPYDESPVKRRGEQYIHQHTAAVDIAAGTSSGIASPLHHPQPNFDPDAFPQAFPYDDTYGYDEYHDRPSDGGGMPAMPSSPSPQPPPLLLQQTPSRTSTPGSLMNDRPHSGGAHANSARWAPPFSGGSRSSPQPPSAGGMAMTPPSTSRSRQAVLRAQQQGEQRPRSPLAREVGKEEN
jgi:hypothetical protein